MNRVNLFKPYVNVEKSLAHIRESLEKGWIGEGPKAEEFEQRCAEALGVEHILALNSGTSALRLALALAGVGPGDEVISTAQTCSATNTAILEQFAIPVFADVDYMTGNLDPQDVYRRITRKTRAIIVVYWAGMPANMTAINKFASLQGIPVIADCAHAWGALYHDEPIALQADYSCFSLQAIKHVTTADGGLLFCSKPDKHEEGRIRRWFGIDRVNRERREDGYHFWNQDLPGYKMHMNDIAAGIGLASLEGWMVRWYRRQSIAEHYRAELRNVPGVTLFSTFPDRTSANWLFTMHVQDRVAFIKALDERGVEASVVHTRNDEHDVFGGLRHDLPVLDEYAKTQVSIPLHDHLTNEDVQQVIGAVKAGW